MKHVFKIVLTSLTLVLFFACSSENDQNPDNTPYYVFNTEDASLIINYDYLPGQIITYKNDAGEELHFKVLENETIKRGSYSNGTFSGGGGILENHYDSKII
jgi:hypothetical protein